MAKKLISYDDQKPGLGLPDVVEEGLNATYGTKFEVQSKIDATDADARYMYKGEVAPGMEVVTHGEDYDFPRPDTPASVIWAGSVEPNGLIDGDLLYLYAPLPGATYFDDFSGATLGQMPPGWTSRWASSEWLVQEDPGATGGRSLHSSVTETGTVRRLITYDAPNNDPDRNTVEIVTKWKSSNNFPLRTAVQASGADGSEGGVWAFNSTSDSRMGRYLNGESKFPFPTDATQVSGMVGVNAWNITRMRAEGDHVKYRTWPSGTTEPSEWLAEAVSPDPLSPGWVGLMSAVSGDRWVDWIGVGTGGRTAPMGG